MYAYHQSRPTRCTRTRLRFDMVLFKIWNCEYQHGYPVFLWKMSPANYYFICRFIPRHVFLSLMYDSGYILCRVPLNRIHPSPTDHNLTVLAILCPWPSLGNPSSKFCLRPLLTPSSHLSSDLLPWPLKPVHLPLPQPPRSATPENSLWASMLKCYTSLCVVMRLYHFRNYVGR